MIEPAVVSRGHVSYIPRVRIYELLSKGDAEVFLMDLEEPLMVRVQSGKRL